MANELPVEATRVVAQLGEVKIIYYDGDFADSARPVEGDVYSGGLRPSIPGRPDGVALVPGHVNVMPGMNMTEVTFHGFVKLDTIRQVQSALDQYPIETHALKFKVHYVSNQFRYTKDDKEVTGVHAKAVCWVEVKDQK